jgi:predicted GNAT family acetyltransferase
MIRLLEEKDRSDVLEYLYQESSYNIFPIGDIEAFGFDTDFQRVYAEFDEEGNYLSILLRYRENTIYYADTVRFNKEYLEIFKKDPFLFFSGKSELMDLISPYLDGYKKQRMYFCEAKELKSLSVPRVDIKRLKTREDAYKLHGLMSGVEEFVSFQQDKEEYVDAKMKSMEMGITLFIEEDGKVVSSVATTAETTKSAMVVSVATKEEARNKGYASALMVELMKEYFINKNKELCLFYDNPSAGKIYHRLGFETIGTWDMYKKKRGE